MSLGVAYLTNYLIIFLLDRLDRNNLGDCIDISDKSLSQQCAFIKEAALDVGVIMKPEVLVNGISMNAAERLMLEAVKSFAENLLRRSRNRLICRQGYRFVFCPASKSFPNLFFQ